MRNKKNLKKTTVKRPSGFRNKYTLDTVNSIILSYVVVNLLL